jgi:hypothetical protein
MIRVSSIPLKRRRETIADHQPRIGRKLKRVKEKSKNADAFFSSSGS